MGKDIERLLSEYSYCHVTGNELLWNCGINSERIKVAHIDSIEFLEDKAVLHSEVGTWMGYTDVEFFADGAVLPAKDDVIIYNHGGNRK
jgi:hypothetical protein